MTELAFWDDPDGPWDRLQIGEHHMPGIWTVECECARDIDVKKSKGKDGARIKDQGYRPSTIHLRGTLWEREHWTAIQAILPDIHPRKKGGARNPIQVSHPALAVMGVHTVYVVKLNAPQVGDRGECTFDIECMEWTPVPKAAKTNVNKHVPTKWTEEQMNANRGMAGEILTMPHHLGSALGTKAFSPAEIAAAAEAEAEAAKRAQEIASLLKHKPSGQRPPIR